MKDVENWLKVKMKSYRLILQLKSNLVIESFVLFNQNQPNGPSGLLVRNRVEMGEDGYEQSESVFSQKKK